MQHQVLETDEKLDHSLKLFYGTTMHYLTNCHNQWSGMKAMAELPSRAEKAEPDIVFSCICSNVL